MTLDEIIAKLQTMLDNPLMNTNDAYSPDTERYPDNRIPFIDIHLKYLGSHKTVDPEQYISNLELKIRKR
jgi:hypothetical protein